MVYLFKMVIDDYVMIFASLQFNLKGFPSIFLFRRGSFSFCHGQWMCARGTLAWFFWLNLASTGSTWCVQSTLRRGKTWLFPSMSASVNLCCWFSICGCCCCCSSSSFSSLSVGIGSAPCAPLNGSFLSHLHGWSWLVCGSIIATFINFNLWLQRENTLHGILWQWNMGPGGAPFILK